MKSIRKSIRKNASNLSHCRLGKYLLLGILLFIISGGWSGCKMSSNKGEYHETDSVQLAKENVSEDEESESDVQLIKEWYELVLGGSPDDKDMDKYLSANLKKKLWTEDYDGTYEYWRFRTIAQDYNEHVGNLSDVDKITYDGEGWYSVKYKDMGYDGMTKVKVHKGKIVEFVPDKTWNQEVTELDSQVKEERDLSWLQGHWIYEEGRFKGHFIIKGNKIIQYSSMNPEKYENTYTINGDELHARLQKDIDLVAKIDFTNHSIDYGNGRWMSKLDEYGNYIPNGKIEEFTCMYTYGTMQELNERGIIKDYTFNKTDVKQDYFTSIGSNEKAEIILKAQNVTIWTAHHSESYKITKENKGEIILKITNPRLFWTASKYLVIEIK